MLPWAKIQTSAPELVSDPESLGIPVGLMKLNLM